MSPSRLCLAFAAAMALPWSAFGQTAERPHVLLLVADDLNDFTGFSGGHPQAETPHLDRLARQGTVFSNAYCNAPVCNASRTSFLTGKHPLYTGTLNNGLNSPLDRTFRNRFQAATGNATVFTLPEVFREAGYFTYGINKIYHGWSDNGHDNDFDDATADPCARDLSWSGFFDLHPSNDPVPPGPDYGEAVPGFPGGRLDDAREADMIDTRVADSAIAFLQRYAADPSDYCDRPFFLALGFRRPHSPHFAPARYFRDEFDLDLAAVPFDYPYNTPANAWPPNGVVPTPLQPDRHADYDSLPLVGRLLAFESGQDTVFDFAPYAMPALPVLEPGLSADSVARAVADAKRIQSLMAYLASVRFLDAQVGRVLAALEADPVLRANTVVVLVSDHGFSLGEKRHWGKFTVWETEMRVPFVVVDPRRPGGRSSAATVDLLDLFPTLLDLADIDPPAFPDGSRYLDGVSLVPYLERPQRYGGHPVLLSLQTEDHFPDGYCAPSHAVRDGTHRYVRLAENGTPDCLPGTGVDRELVYHLGADRQVDPHEWRDLAGTPAGNAAARLLEQHLPGGPLFGPAPSFAVRIRRDGLPCTVDTAALPTLQATLPGPGPWRLAWDAGPAGTGTGAAFTPSPAGLPAGTEGLLVQLTVTDTLTGERAVDRLYLPLAPAPDPGFTLSAEGPNGLRVRGFRPGAPLLGAEWTWSDGFTHQGPEPPMHRVGMPGAHWVRVRLRYGLDPGSACTAEHADTLVLPEAGFAALGCQPPATGHAAVLSPRSVDLSWTPVWGADRWQLAWRRADAVGGPWTVAERPGRGMRLRDLDQHRDYRWKVRAVCGSDSSAWSEPLAFHTAACPAPAPVQLQGLGSRHARVRWRNAPAADAGTRLALAGPGLAFDTLLAPGVDRLPLPDLDAGAAYTLTLAARCADVFGRPDIEGELPAVRRFTAPAPREADAWPMDGARLRAWPNPADGPLTLALEGLPAGHAGLALWLVDEAGRAWRRWPVPAGAERFARSAAGLPPGTYRAWVPGTRLSAAVRVTAAE